MGSIREIFTKSAESRNLPTPAQAFGGGQSSSGSNKSGGKFLNVLQAGLSVIGSIPVVGVVPNVINSTISLLRGDKTGAALSALALVPGMGTLTGLMGLDYFLLKDMDEELKKKIALLLKDSLGKMLVGSKIAFQGMTGFWPLSTVDVVEVAVTKCRQKGVRGILSRKEMNEVYNKINNNSMKMKAVEFYNQHQTFTGADEAAKLMAKRKETYLEEWIRVSSDPFFSGQCWGVNVNDEYSKYVEAARAKGYQVADMEKFIDYYAPWWELVEHARNDVPVVPLSEKIEKTTEVIAVGLCAVVAIMEFPAYFNTVKMYGTNIINNPANLTVSLDELRAQELTVIANLDEEIVIARLEADSIAKIEAIATVEPEIIAIVEPEVIAIEPEIIAIVEPEVIAIEPEIMATVEPEIVATVEPEIMATVEPEVVAKGGLNTGGGSNAERKLQPSNTPNPDATPGGTITKISPKADEATTRSLERENEAADILAKNGYEVEQNPKVEGTSREPDYRIEGELADCYSPAGNTSVRNIGSTIKEKVIEKAQASRVVLNLKDWNGNVSDIVEQLNNYPIEGLDEVIAITKEDTVISIYP